MVAKKDCFAYLHENTCLALREQKCDVCGFYKTPKQVKIEREKAKNRFVRIYRNHLRHNPHRIDFVGFVLVCRCS